VRWESLRMKVVRLQLDRKVGWKSLRVESHGVSWQWGRNDSHSTSSSVRLSQEATFTSSFSQLGGAWLLFEQLPHLSFCLGVCNFHRKWLPPPSPLLGNAWLSPLSVKGKYCWYMYLMFKNYAIYKNCSEHNFNEEQKNQ